MKQIKGFNALSEREHVCDKYVIECTCKVQWYTRCMIAISLLGIIGFAIFNARKLKLFKGHLFPNTVKAMFSHAQYYAPLKSNRTSGSVNLLKRAGKLSPEHVKIRPNILWDILKLEWNEV